jgi:RNA polymerase sigma-70 factor (ECF subfamily)
VANQHLSDDDQDDAKLIARVRAGERIAFAPLIERHQSALRSMLSIYCRSTEELEEFLQLTFVTAYFQLHQFRAESPLRPWLKAIAMNALRKEYRRLKLSTRLSEDYLRYLQLSIFEEEQPSATNEDWHSALTACLERLPGQARRLIEARYRETRSYEQLETHFGASASALKQKLYRLREQLRLCMERQTRQNRLESPNR